MKDKRKALSICSQLFCGPFIQVYHDTALFAREARRNHCFALEFDVHLTLVQRLVVGWE